MWKNSTIIIGHLVVNVCKKLSEREEKLRPRASLRTRNRFSGLKKKLDGKFSKPSVKNFQIYLSSLKETFLGAPTTNDMHNDNLIFLSSERE